MSNCRRGWNADQVPWSKPIRVRGLFQHRTEQLLLREGQKPARGRLEDLRREAGSRVSGLRYVGFGVEGVVTGFGGLSRLTAQTSPHPWHLTYHTLIDPMSSARPSLPHFGQDRLDIWLSCRL